MLYIKYNEYKNKFHNAQDNFNYILNEKEVLFNETQPRGMTYDKEKINGGIHSNVFDNYIMSIEAKNIDKRLEEARSILEDRERLLKIAENEIRQSKDWYDIAYVYRFIDNRSVKEIRYKMPYCRTSIYKILKEIEKNINCGQK